MKRLLIVPAAGRGSRLGSELPKLLVPVNGRAMIDYLFDLYRDTVSAFLLVVSPSAHELVLKHCDGRRERIELLLQESPTGMLDAIMVPRARVGVIVSDEIWVTWCDQVAVEPTTIHRLARLMSAESRPAFAFPTVVSEAPYIHFARDAKGEIAAVLHRREGDTMPGKGEGDIGLFAMSAEAYLRDLPVYATRASVGNATGERNFLPFIPWLARRGKVETVPADSEMEAVGINTQEDLVRIAQHLQPK